MNKKKSTFLIIAIIAICFFIYIFRGNFNKGDYSQTYYDLNTVSNITLYNVKESDSKEILDECGKILLDIDNTMSKTRDYSDVTKINQNAGKGYAADQIVKYLKSKDVESAIINLGGNVFILGEKEKNTPFKVGIQDPTSKDGSSIGNISVSNKSVVTSGIYERYLEKDGIIYHHMIDPSTGYPFENNLSSVTIISSSSIVGDGLSTTTFGLGLQKGMKLIESLDNTDAIFITKDKKVYTTSNLKGKLNLKNESFKLMN